MTKHLVIPDTQIRPGDSLDFLNHIGRYIVDKQPDVIIQIGDFADMPSLSSYDVGKRCFEGRRYKADLESVYRAMAVLLQPIKDYNYKQVRNAKKQYKPRLVLTLGNHEDRINRVIESDPKLDGTISIADLCYQDYGWEVKPFLKVITIDGIAYSHYFTSGVLGRPVATAATLLNKKHMSCFAGHQQGKQIAYGSRADGTPITAIISGSCYEHDEDYMGEQGNKHWRGVWMLHEVKNGSFDEMPVSLDYLRSKYGNNERPT